jgi:Metallo-beta-lactamase superfamily
MRLSRAAWIGALAVSVAVPSIATAHDDKHHHSDPGLAARIAARTHYFGAANVDQRTGEIDRDKVILTWFSVSSYALAAKGHVLLLDSYIYRLADTPAYVPSTVQELVDLRPEAIFIGHGHGDHADNAAYIAGKTGARIFGAAEHCVAMQADAEKVFGAGATVKCTALTTTGAAPGSEIMDIDFLRPDICIRSFKHLHSGPAPLDPDFPPNPINPVRDPRVAELYPTQPPPTLDTRTTGVGGGGAVSMFYLLTFRDSNFTLAWHDTNGPIKDNAPQIIPILRDLPKVDVEMGSLVSTGETINGVRDIAMYIQLLEPKYFYGGHSDNFNIGASPYYHQALQRQFAIFNIPVDQRPVVVGMHDPYDYVRPGLGTYSLKDPQWKAVPQGKRQGRCGGGHW